MKPFKNLISMQSKKLFIELFQLDEIDIIFDFNKFRNNIFAFDYKKELLYYYNRKDKYLRIDENIMSTLKKELDFNCDEVDVFLKNMIKKYMNIKGFDIDTIHKNISLRIKNHFNITTLYF